MSMHTQNKFPVQVGTMSSAIITVTTTVSLMHFCFCSLITLFSSHYYLVFQLIILFCNHSFNLLLTLYILLFLYIFCHNNNNNNFLFSLIAIVDLITIGANFLLMMNLV